VAYYTFDSRSGEYDYEAHTPMWEPYTVPDTVPERPRAMLQSANDARHTPIACVAAALRAVEAMQWKL
jgi:hypothetical protein